MGELFLDMYHSDLNIAKVDDSVVIVVREYPLLSRILTENTLVEGGWRYDYIGSFPSYLSSIFSKPVQWWTFPVFNLQGRELLSARIDWIEPGDNKDFDNITDYRWRLVEPRFIEGGLLYAVSNNSFKSQEQARLDFDRCWDKIKRKDFQ